MSETAEKEEEKGVLPDELEELVKMFHVKRAESRPDEEWRTTAPEKAPHIAPYKHEEEEAAGEIPHYDEGGVVDPQAQEKMILDPDLPEMSKATVPPPPQPPTLPPAAPPAVPPQQPMDADFMDRASKMLGLDPQGQASFLKLLGDKSKNAQLGAGVAGIGDAIASGGTLGKVNPNGMGRAEDLIQNRENAGIAGMQTLRGNQEKTVDLSQRLQAQDPNSPLSKYAQKAYAGLGKKLGLDLTHASASVIGDLTGKGVAALNDEAELALKAAALGLQSKQVDATIENQGRERETAEKNQQREAAGALSGQSFFRRLQQEYAPSPEQKKLREIAGIDSPVSGLKPGTEKKGYVFVGGNPAEQKSWRKK